MDPSEFFEAIRKGDGERFDALLQQHPELARARNGQGVSALLFARYCNRLEMVEKLLPLNPGPDIFEAAALGKRNRVAELVTSELGLVASFSTDGFTALHYACFFGHPNVAEFLLRYGADANARSKNATAVMPLHSAVANVRKLKTVEWLLEYGAKINATQPGGWTALHAAAANGDAEIVAFLLEKGAATGQKAENGQTASDRAQEKGHEQVVAVLRAHA